MNPFVDLLFSLILIFYFHFSVLKDVYDKESLAVDELCQEEDGACAVVMEGRNTVDTVECSGCFGKVTEIDEWKKRYEQEAEKRKQLKKVYMNLAIRFSEIELKYTALLKNATANAYHQSVDEAESSADVFTAKEVKFLQCMPLDKKNDCSFILHCLKFAYKDPSVLASKTLKGTAAWLEIKSDGEQVQHEEKAPLTPQKVERVKGLFMERISQCEIHSVEYGERIKDSYVNKMFAAGIRNLSKKFK